ncbi:MAG: hypothetical protein RJA49_1165 [Actinomycetota bacterium]
MLRKMRIGGRVNLLIAVPLLALIAASTLGYLALQRSSVRGDQYQALKLAQDLRADTLPPPATLLPAWAEVNMIGVLLASPDPFTPSNTGEIQQHLHNIAVAQQNFSDSLRYWSGQPLDARLQASFVQVSRVVGDRFFKAIDAQLKPAVAKRDAATGITVIAGVERWYKLQQVASLQALTFAQTAVLQGEAETDDYVARVLLFGGAGAALLVMLTLLLSVRVRRSIVRPIRALAAQATSVARHDLPEAVDAVAELPADAAVPRLPAFEVASDDELGDLAASFNSVQDAAVDLAAEQARTRRVVSENLVNIARRNQNLLGRTLGFITTLEQGERDPEVLDNLFRIDHLTTRMRRNAQSLLVLAGAEPTRLWAPPVAVGDVVRAALSEVENYGQVEIGDIGDIAVNGSIAPEVSHLLAELLENATSFSPPTTTVTVVGRTVPDGHQLAIFDYGLGMTEADMAAANARLNQVSSIDRDSSKMLGFQVVARLAARHDIKVMLTTTPGGSGVTAVVRLPKSILEVAGSDHPETMPLADLPEASARLTQPLPIVPMTIEPMSLASLESSLSTGDVDPVATMRTAPPPIMPVMPAAPVYSDLAPPVAEPLTTAGLPKRVRGAQLPDLGTAQLEAPPVRAADEVRNSLTSLQRGIDLSRQHGIDD